MSLKELALAAQVSISTASKAFSGSREISEATRKAVFDTAKQMGLYEKYAKENDFGITIGIICPEICSEFYTRMLDKINNSIEAAKAFSIICISGFNQENINRCFKHLAYNQKVDGIISFSDSDIQNPDKFPLVKFGEMSDSSCDSIKLNIGNAIDSAVKYLIENGHERIGFIGEKNTEKKFSIFLNAMKENNLHFDHRLAYNGEKRFEKAGYDGVEHFLNLNQNDNCPLPTAIICAYDYIAIGAINAIREKNLNVPEDISIIGMDNIYAASILDTPLTSIFTPLDDSCDLIVDMLMRKISNNHLSLKNDSIITSTLIQRQSVRNLNFKQGDNESM